MDDYRISAEKASKVLTQTFSTSFSSAITLFTEPVQQDIYNIYGLVRVADEVVDTYQGSDAGILLADLETEVYRALDRGFSANIIVQAFCETASKYSIDASLIGPFFESMRIDLTKKTFTNKEYKSYIYGSAEVVGLMCLKVFTGGDKERYRQLRGGAMALGSAFQKVNFLRDIKDDYETRGRYYFPEGSFQDFDEKQKQEVITDIKKDFQSASVAIEQLPDNARFATQLAFSYYNTLLSVIQRTPVSEIKKRRVSVSRFVKFRLLLKAKIYGR